MQQTGNRLASKSRIEVATSDMLGWGSLAMLAKLFLESDISVESPQLFSADTVYAYMPAAAIPVEGVIARLGAGGNLCCPGTGSFQELPLGHHSVHQTQLGRLLVVDGRARQHHLRSCLQAYQPRQPLCTSKAWQDPQLELRQAQLRACTQQEAPLPPPAACSR